MLVLTCCICFSPKQKKITTIHVHQKKLKKKVLLESVKSRESFGQDENKKISKQQPNIAAYSKFTKQETRALESIRRKTHTFSPTCNRPTITDVFHSILHQKSTHHPLTEKKKRRTQSDQHRVQLETRRLQSTGKFSLCTTISSAVEATGMMRTDSAQLTRLEEVAQKSLFRDVSCIDNRMKYPPNRTINRVLALLLLAATLTANLGQTVCVSLSE